MVKFLSLFFLLPFALFGQSVKVVAEVENNTAYVETPIEGVLSITHLESEKVEADSFLFKEKPLKAELVHEVPISSTLKISYYRFTLPPEEKGLRVLPPISALVGGERYTSVPTTYEVKKRPPSPPAQKRKQPTLELSAQIVAPTPLYPGQRALFIYEISFSKSVSLSKEVLPLLQAEGMIKIGEPQATSSLNNGETTQRIIQIVKTEKPGEYTYGPSLIEGKAYTTDRQGNKIYEGPLLSASFPALNLRVTPLPKENQPFTFNGAIGNYQLSLDLLSSPKVTLGDPLTLQLTLQGESDFEEVKMPDLYCQPGWSGLFVLNDLPPFVNIQDKTKTFTFDIRPLTTQLKEIPPIAFSFFNPEASTYVTLKSKPIPIEVAPPPEKELPETKEELPETKRTTEILPSYTKTPIPPFFTTSKVFWLLPAFLALLLLQYFLKHNKTAPPTSRQLFKDATTTQMLKNAFLKRLMELGEISSLEEQLPDSGYSKEVKAFFQNVEEKLYKQGKPTSFKTIFKEAKTLFKRMEK